MEKRVGIKIISFKLVVLTFLCILVFSIPISSSMQLNLTYDGNGNLITGDGKYREYNEFNQLIRVGEGNSSSGRILEEYIYHPTEDRILIKKTNTDEFNPFDELVFYFGDYFTRARTNLEGNDKISDTYYVKDDYGIVGEIEYNTTQIDDNFTFAEKKFYHNDHLGSTSVITNESGDIIEETFYEPYGEILEGGSESRYSYEGKEFSEVTEDYDFNFRKYDPELGIFTQPEQIFPNVYDPQQLNRYRFERNNPYKYVDENGKNPIEANALYYMSSWVSSLIVTSLLRTWRSDIEFSSLNLLEKGWVRAYDVALKSQVDVMYWSFMEQETTRSIVHSAIPKSSRESIWDIRRGAIFGASSLAFPMGGLYSSPLKILSNVDLFSSILTGGGIVENFYNLISNPNVQINSAQQSTISSTSGGGSNSNYRSTSSSSSPGKTSDGVISNVVNKISSTIKSIGNAIKNFIGGLFR